MRRRLSFGGMGWRLLAAVSWVYGAGCDDDGAATDAGADVVTDGGQDVGEVDQGGDAPIELGPWETCPTSADWEGEASWAAALQVRSGALYCGLGNEGIVDPETGAPLWAEQRANRAQLWLAPATYPLPNEDGEYTYRLPLCTRYEDVEASPVQETGGPLVVTSNTFEDVTYRTVHLRQPLTGENGTAWELELWASGQVVEGGEAPVVVLDGGALPPFEIEPGDFQISINICSPSCASGEAWRQMDSCDFAAYQTRRHTVEFEDGEVAFDLRYGQSMASTEPGMLVRAAGVLDGVSFETEDYWDLVYTPGHHHFVRHFMVLLDDPGGDVCALAAEGQYEGGDPSTGPDLKLFDCDLDLLETRPITGGSFELLPPAP